MRTPGFPFFMAVVLTLFGAGAKPTVLAQIALSVGTCWLTWAWARRLVPGGAALLAALLVAIDPPTVCHSLLLLTETLFTFLLVAALLCLWSCRQSGAALARAGSPAASAGAPSPAATAPARALRPGSLRLALVGALLLGAGALVRPIGLYLVPLAALWAFVVGQGSGRRRLAIALLVAVVGASLPVGWALRNQAAGVGFTLSDIEAANLLLFRAAPVLARVERTSWDVAGRKLEQEVARLAALEKREAGSGPAVDRIRRRVAREVLTSHPMATLAVFADGAFRMWVGPGNTDLLILLGVVTPESPGSWPVTGSPALRAVASCLAASSVALRVATIVLTVVGLLGWTRDRRWPELGFMIAVLAYFTVLSASPGAYARLRVPATPAASIVAAAALAGRRRTAAPPLGPGTRIDHGSPRRGRGDATGREARASGRSPGARRPPAPGARKDRREAKSPDPSSDAGRGSALALQRKIPAVARPSEAKAGKEEERKDRRCT
ncbi:MAG: glycosyltransferase family 39 protein [Candidatus Riflebacteria bacterium]|nr:glycosyltransferase family 39 protein [Candidatus Riflebacteria bacterium]